MLHLARIWDVLVAHWMSQGVLLEPIGLIVTCLKHQKFIQSGPGWHSEDTCFDRFTGGTGPVYVSELHLDALAAQPRCLECC